MTKPALILLLVTLITGIFCLSPQADAAKSNLPSGPASSISLTPTLGGYHFAGAEHFQTTLLYGVKLGYDIVGTSIADSLGIEATYNHFSTTSTKDTDNAQGNLFRIDATYPFTPRDKVVPFLALGLGGINVSSGDHPDTNFLLNYGAGVKYFYENYLAVRLDARHILVYDNINTRNNFEVSVGVSYYFGKERKKKPELLADQDLDGVPDNLDKCRNTRKGIKVDRNGCPADSDKDGVPDYLDKCPDTPIGVPVTPDGCPQNGRENDTRRPGQDS